MRVAAAIVLCLAAAGAAAAEYFPVGHVLRPLLADPVEPRSFVGLLSADAADTDAPSDDLINSDFVIGGRLVAGMDVKGFEETDWDAGVSGKLGLQFGAPHPARRGLSLFLVVTTASPRSASSPAPRCATTARACSSTSERGLNFPDHGGLPGNGNCTGGRTMTAKNQLRIGITGSYGGLNLGDEAILQSMIVELRREIPDAEITVFSRDAEDTKRRHGVERAVPVRKISRAEAVPEVQRLDLLLFGGGGILYDAEAKVYLREVLIAKELGVPVMLYAVGAGPLKDPANQAAVREALEGVKAITVRERAAQQVLEEAGVHRDVVVTADPALLLKPEPLPRNFLKGEGLEGRRHLIGMSVREPGAAAPDLDVEQYHGLLANAADFMIDRWDADIVFVPMERAVLDTQHSHAVVAKMLRAQRASVLKGEYSSGQILSMMGRFQFAVGMRLHFLIFAALAGTPLVALPYSGKVSGFLEDLKLPSPPLKLVSPGRLIAHLDASWDKRRSLKAHLKKNVPSLQERARQTAKIAAQLLSHRTLRDVKAAA